MQLLDRVPPSLTPKEDTLALMRAGGGERSIGRIYAANTLGAIVGVCAPRGDAQLGTVEQFAASSRRGFTTALLACMAYSGAVTIVFYALVGPPTPP